LISSKGIAYQRIACMLDIEEGGIVFFFFFLFFYTVL
jgi:hypothetical protein